MLIRLWFWNRIRILKNYSVRAISALVFYDESLSCTSCNILTIVRVFSKELVNMQHGIYAEHIEYYTFSILYYNKMDLVWRLYCQMYISTYVHLQIGFKLYQYNHDNRVLLQY